MAPDANEVVPVQEIPRISEGRHASSIFIDPRTYVSDFRLCLQVHALVSGRMYVCIYVCT